MPLHRATWLTNTYTFAPPVYLQEYTDDFSRTASRLIRLPNMDGAYDEYGMGRAPREGSSIRQSIVLRSATRAGMDALRDGLKAMLFWPKHRLFMRPTNFPSEVERFAWVRLVDIQLSREEQNQTDLHQRAQLIWSAADPHWYGGGTESAALWGGGWTWGAASGVPATWGSALGNQACSGFQTDFTITRQGNATVYPRIYITTGAGQTLQNPVIERFNPGGGFADWVVVAATIGANQSIQIDCQRFAVRVNGKDAYGLFGSLNVHWMRLLPGANTMRVRFANAGNAGSVRFVYHNAWF